MNWYVPVYTMRVPREPMSVDCSPPKKEWHHLLLVGEGWGGPFDSREEANRAALLRLRELRLELEQAIQAIEREQWGAVDDSDKYPVISEAHPWATEDEP